MLFSMVNGDFGNWTVRVCRGGASRRSFREVAESGAFAVSKHYGVDRSLSAFLRCLRNSPVVLGMMPNGLMDHFPLALRFSSRTLIHGALMVAGFGQQLLVAGPARRFEFAGFERRGHRTARLARVRAVVKLALAREGSDA